MYDESSLLKYVMLTYLRGDDGVKINEHIKLCEVGMIKHTIKWMDIIGNSPIKLGLPILWNWEFTY